MEILKYLDPDRGVVLVLISYIKISQLLKLNYDIKHQIPVAIDNASNFTEIWGQKQIQSS